MTIHNMPLSLGIGVRRHKPKQKAGRLTQPASNAPLPIAALGARSEAKSSKSKPLTLVRSVPTLSVDSLNPLVRKSIGMNLIKSKKRVSDHGEVFTPPWMVDAMLDLVKAEAERIESRFLEPACGTGHFLVTVLDRKLSSVERLYARTPFERRHFSLLALMSCYGIELLADNVAECRANMLGLFKEHIRPDDPSDLAKAAVHVLAVNVIQGDALTMKSADGSAIVFAEWGYLGKGRFQRRDFRLDVLTGTSSFKAEGSLFAGLGQQEIFQPVKTYKPVTIEALARIDTSQEAA